jgi:hypothetical protein
LSRRHQFRSSLSLSPPALRRGQLPLRGAVLSLPARPLLVSSNMTRASTAVTSPSAIQPRTAILPPFVVVHRLRRSWARRPRSTMGVPLYRAGALRGCAAPGALEVDAASGAYLRVGSSRRGVARYARGAPASGAGSRRARHGHWPVDDGGHPRRAVGEIEDEFDADRAELFREEKGRLYVEGHRYTDHGGSRGPGRRLTRRRPGST